MTQELVLETDGRAGERLDHDSQLHYTALARGGKPKSARSSSRSPKIRHADVNASRFAPISMRYRNNFCAFARNVVAARALSASILCVKLCVKLCIDSARVFDSIKHLRDALDTQVCAQIFFACTATQSCQLLIHECIQLDVESARGTCTAYPRASE